MRVLTWASRQPKWPAADWLLIFAQFEAALQRSGETLKPGLDAFVQQARAQAAQSVPYVRPLMRRHLLEVSKLAARLDPTDLAAHLTAMQSLYVLAGTVMRLSCAPCDAVSSNACDVESMLARACAQPALRANMRRLVGLWTREINYAEDGGHVLLLCLRAALSAAPLDADTVKCFMDALYQAMLAGGTHEAFGPTADLLAQAIAHAAKPLSSGAEITPLEAIWSATRDRNHWLTAPFSALAQHRAQCLEVLRILRGTPA
jgi:hypothetical protein